MLNIQIDEKEALKLYMEKIEEKIKDFDADLVFWDSKELCRRTCMSWNFIQEQFFFDPRFPKKKVKSKWIYPAKETREFLLAWLKEK